MAAIKYYAYRLVDGTQGVVEGWSACEKIVSGKSDARYRGFETKAEAEEWLASGAHYVSQQELRLKRKLTPGVYFDAGTGRGEGVEVSVTDEKGEDLLHLVLPKKKLNRYGKHLLSVSTTNNYGELLALKFAFQVAEKKKAKRIFGDSKLVLDYWSKGIMKEKDLLAKTAKLIREVRAARRVFESSGGTVKYVSGDVNPADLGFH